LQWLLDPDETPDGGELVASLGAALSLALEEAPELSGGARDAVPDSEQA
jgi:hypothetical protein